MKNHYANLLEEFRCLEAKTVSNVKCNKCDKNLEDLEKMKNPQEENYSARQIFKCDQCGNEFNEKWKLNAHLKTCRTNKCDVCEKTFRYEDLRKKHILIAHENLKIYCHFFNNEKTCPYSEDCVFLHEDSPSCKYSTACERNYCMFKHGSKNEPVDNEIVGIHDKAGDKKNEESEKDVTLENESENLEKYDSIVIVDVEIVNADSDLSIDRTFVDKCEQGNNYNVEDVTDKTDAKVADNAGEKVFACKMCDFKAGKKFDMTTHLEDIHYWCRICFSTFNNKDDLKNHLKNHTKK